MGGIIGGIGALAGTSDTADAANGQISGLVDRGAKLIAPWTNQTGTTLDAWNAALGVNGKTGVTANSPEYQQLGMDRLQNPTNSYDPNAIGKTYQASPGYEWAVQQGQNAIENSATARAGLLTGATARQVQTNAEQMANQNYWQYVGNVQQAMSTDYNQRQQQQTNIQNESAQNLQATGLGTGLFGSAIGGTASVAGSQMGAQTNAWGQIGSGLGSLFSFA